MEVCINAMSIGIEVTSIDITSMPIDITAMSMRIVTMSIDTAAASIRPAAILIPACGMEVGMTTVYCLLLSAVDVEHDGDDEDEECFELEEVLPVGAPRVVEGERVEREGAEEEADPEPDELSLPVPHPPSEPLQFAQAVGGRFERLVLLAEAEAHLARAEF